MRTRNEIVFGILIFAILGAWALSASAQEADVYIDSLTDFEEDGVSLADLDWVSISLEEKTAWKSLQLYAAAMSNPSRLEGLHQGHFASADFIAMQYQPDEIRDWAAGLADYEANATIAVSAKFAGVKGSTPDDYFALNLSETCAANAKCYQEIIAKVNQVLESQEGLEIRTASDQDKTVRVSGGGVGYFWVPSGGEVIGKPFIAKSAPR